MAALSTISKMVARAGTFLIVAPIIGPQNQGRIVVTSAWSAVMVLVIAYGLQVRILREIPINPVRARGILRDDLRAMIILALPTSIAAGIVACVGLPREDWIIFASIYIGTLGSVIGDYCSAALRAVNDFRREALVAALSSGLQVALAVAAAILFKPLIFLALAIMLARLLFAVGSIYAVFSEGAVRGSDGRAVRAATDTLKSAFPYFVDGSLSVVLSQIDVVLLSYLVDRHAIGIYSAGSRLVQMVLVTPWVAANLMIPSIARAQREGGLSRELRRLTLGIGTLAGASTIGLLVAGPLFTIFLLGPAYRPLNRLWPAFGALTLARFYEAYFGIVMTASGRMVRRVFVQFAAVVAIGVGAAVFVPLLGVSALIMIIGVTYCGIGAYYALTLSRADILSNRFSVVSGAMIALTLVGAALFAIQR